nr:PREDICTED: uncharacterized protein C1orf94 homolog [Anolis carolinensis]|eukprot:XP_008119916.1 PREDICTED: uncharacterized protein C1orf94 homolog [Anolis carolinensis]
MLTSRSSLQCSTVNPKGSFPLGPFPRHIWIHHNTPQDSLDKACHEIWKRVQGLPEELQPRSSSPLLQLSCHPIPSSEALREDSSSTSSSSQKEPAMASEPDQELNSDTDEVYYDFSPSSEKPLQLQVPGEISQEEQSLESSICKDEISLLVEQEYLSLTQENAADLEAQRSDDEKVPSAAPCNASNNNLTVASDEDQALEERDAMENVYRALTGNKREVKLRSICDAQLSTNSTVTGILLPAKLIYKNTKSTESGNSNPVSSNAQIAKLLAQFPLKRVEAVKSMDNKGMTEETKSIKDILQNNVFGSAPHKENLMRSSSIMTMVESQGSGHKKQLPVFAKICSKNEPELVADGLCLSHGPSGAFDKNNIKYSGNVFTPRFPSTSTTTSLKQTMWLSLNYPPPPLFPNHSNFPQYQSLFQQRARIPFQQTLHPQLGCFSRQEEPFLHLLDRCNIRAKAEKLLKKK